MSALFLGYARCCTAQRDARRGLGVEADRSYVDHGPDRYGRTRPAQLLAGRELRVVTVDLTEYERPEGCVTCLSQSWRSSGIRTATFAS